LVNLISVFPGSEVTDVIQDQSCRDPNIERVNHVERELAELIHPELGWDHNAMISSFRDGARYSFAFGPEYKQHVVIGRKLESLKWNQL
jgi:hypothetical protein